MSNPSLAALDAAIAKREDPIRKLRVRKEKLAAELDEVKAAIRAQVAELEPLEAERFELSRPTGGPPPQTIGG